MRLGNSIRRKGVKFQTCLFTACFPNGTIEIYNPDAIVYTSLLAVQDEGLSNATICAMTISGTQHTITNCSQVIIGERLLNCTSISYVTICAMTISGTQHTITNCSQVIHVTTSTDLQFGERLHVLNFTSISFIKKACHLSTLKCVVVY